MGPDDTDASVVSGRGSVCTWDLPYDDAVIDRRPHCDAPGPAREASAPPPGEDWTALVAGPLPSAVAHGWVVRPDCGAVVVFTGTARDRSAGRDDVSLLEYEAYEAQVVPRLDEVLTELRRRWPAVGRVALLHRVGEVPIGDAAVLVAVSAPHRGEAFDAARFGIDAVKASVPIWKRERWAGGEDWGLASQDLVEPRQVMSPVGGGVPADLGEPAR